MTLDDVSKLDWSKGDGLLPVVVQHARTGRVLMLGYMNQIALRETLSGGRVVFFSRSRQTLWTKGETSGHFLDVVDVSADCDADAILVLADPLGPKRAFQYRLPGKYFLQNESSAVGRTLGVRR